MKILKQILNYLFWTVVSFLAAFVYMRIILGPKPEPATGFMKIFDWVYETVMVHVGLRIGGIIALLYILLEPLRFRKPNQIFS